MAYSQIPTRTTADANSAADVNQLQDNIEAIKGGSGSAAPTDTLESVISDISTNTADISKIKKVVSFYIDGTLYTGTSFVYWLSDASYAISKVKIGVSSAPTGSGSSVTVDVHKNSTTIFTTQSKRPSISNGDTQDDSETPDVTSISENDILSIDIDSVGSTDAGDDLMVSIVLEYA